MDPVSLPSNSNLNQVAELRERFLIALEIDKSIRIDASFVENISTPLMQLLLIVMRDVEALGGNFFIEKPSQNFIEMLKNFGCSDYFERSFK